MSQLVYRVKFFAFVNPIYTEKGYIDLKIGYDKNRDLDSNGVNPKFFVEWNEVLYTQMTSSSHCFEGKEYPWKFHFISKKDLFRRPLDHELGRASIAVVVGGGYFFEYHSPPFAPLVANPIGIEFTRKINLDL